MEAAAAGFATVRDVLPQYSSNASNALSCSFTGVFTGVFVVCNWLLELLKSVHFDAMSQAAVDCSF
jgi:hypothetical protein